MSKMWKWILVLNCILCENFGRTSKVELTGPQLTSLPSPLTHFSNSAGVVLTCGGSGPPPLTISWLSPTGEELTHIPGIREQLENGSLHFTPFKPEDYIPTVHNGQYRCSVRNPVGTFLSPVFNVRAIVDHPFEVVITSARTTTRGSSSSSSSSGSLPQSHHILDGGGGDEWMEGSPALLSCDITPSFYTQFVRVLQWKSIDQFGHESEISADDSRYQISTDGKLLIFQANYQQLFVCICENMLNKKVQASSPYLLKARGSMGVTGGGGIPPKQVDIIRTTSSFPVEAHGAAGVIIKVEPGTTQDLLCLAVGSPSPSFRWEKYHKGKLVPVTSLLPTLTTSPSGGGAGPLLRLTDVSSLLHNGTYRCEVSNTFGTFSLEYSVIVQEPPKLHIEPRRKTMRNGESVELSCKVEYATGGGRGMATSNSNSVNKPGSNGDFIWFKDGKPLLRTPRIKLSPGKLLIFNSRLEDQGVYQCFTSVPSPPPPTEISLQGASTILFESSAPELVHTFISQSLQPGPSVSLKCSAVGNPIPLISWFIDDGIVLSSVGTHGGAASSSSPGSSAISADYSRTGSHFWSPYTRFSVGASPRRAQSSETASYLNISEIRVEDSGLYKCTATNLVGEVSHQARMNVYGAIFVKEMGSLTLVAGQRALIPCHYGGYPVDKIIWQKDSRDIDLRSGGVATSSHGRSGPTRFTILANGTLQIERVSTDQDKGRYTCLVSNRKGEIASGSVDVNVMRPPVISTFKFDDNLKEGQRTSISCNVISGDLPIEIVWLKDSSRIPQQLNVTENRVKFLSVLIFEELKSEHSGEYQCAAENAAAVVRQKASLKVKVPPKWTKEPQDAKVILHSDHILPCSATGVPPPKITWMRDSGNGIRSAIKSDHKFHVMEDGSLKILQVEETDASVYTCEAVNGVGNGGQRSIRLYVIIPAKVSAPLASVVVAEGVAALLKCQIRGDGPLQVMWKKNSVLIEKNQSQQPTSDFDSPSSSSSSSSNLLLLEKRVVLQSVEGSGNSERSALLRIEPSERSDSGLYVCMASNQYGRDEDRISLEVKARPHPPENFMVEEIGSRFIRLRWSMGGGQQQQPQSSSSLSSSSSSSPSSSSSTPVTYFILQWRKSQESVSWESGQVWNMSVQNPATHAVIEELLPVTNYEIRVFASNHIGYSFPTEPLAVLTLPEAPSGSPQNVSAAPTGPKSVLVKWQPPEKALQHGQILGFHVIAVLQSISGTSPGGSNKTTLVDQKWEQQSELKGLRPNSQYRFSVRAYNSAGMGPESSYVFIQTPEGAPDSPPLHLQCEPLSPKSLQVQWEPPPFHLSNGNILGYKVVYLPLQAEKMGEKPEVKKTSNRETTLHGLKSFTSYSVKTLAYTLGGESETSESVVCTTEEDIPEEPAAIKVMSLSGSSALVSWLPPDSPNGLITKYTIFWRPDDSELVKEKPYTPLGDEDQLSLEIRRLKESHRYSFWISAATNSGSGKGSRVESVQITAKVPARIASFPVLKNSGLEQPIRLPCKAIGVPSPKVFWTKNGLSLPSHSLLRNGSLFISRVKDIDEGMYTCRVENEHGSDEIEHRVIISRPPSSVPIFIGYVTDTSMQIHWDPPERADPPLTGYLLQYQEAQQSSSSSQDWKSFRLGPRLTSYSVENLLCGTLYHFRIFGENSVGRGEASLVLKASTNGNPPEVPRLTEILDGNGTMIRIDLTRWSDGGCPVTNFHIQYRKVGDEYSGGGAGNWIKIWRDNSTRVFIFQTDPNSKYQIKIRVDNDAGSQSKTFNIESHPDFFTNYAKVLERVEVEERMNGSYVSLYTDPHVLVPIVSAIICTFALAVCVLMVIKRKNQAKSDWKFKQSSSQQTWLSGSDGGGQGNHKCAAGGVIGENGTKCGEQGCGGNMAIYATLNSTKPIPMTIRDSTVRFQTFGQHENYEAPSLIPGYLKRNRRKSASSPLEEMCMQQVSCQMEFANKIEPPREFRSSSRHTTHHHHHPSDSEEEADEPHHFHHVDATSSRTSVSQRRDIDSGPAAVAADDGLYHDYSCPYQYATPSGTNAADNRPDQIDNPHQPAAVLLRPGAGTLKKKQAKLRNRGSTGSEYFD